MYFSGVSQGGYLVAVRDCVVMIDLCDIIRDFDAAAVILRTSDPAMAPLALASAQQVRAVFLEAQPGGALCRAVEGQLAGGRGRLVLLGADAEDAYDTWPARSRRWTTLPRPFSTERVLAHLLAITPAGTIH